MPGWGEPFAEALLARGDLSRAQDPSAEGQVGDDRDGAGFVKLARHEEVLQFTCSEAIVKRPTRTLVRISPPVSIRRRAVSSWRWKYHLSDWRPDGKGYVPRCRLYGRSGCGLSHRYWKTARPRTTAETRAGRLPIVVQPIHHISHQRPIRQGIDQASLIRWCRIKLNQIGLVTDD